MKICAIFLCMTTACRIAHAAYELRLGQDRPDRKYVESDDQNYAKYSHTRVDAYDGYWVPDPNSSGDEDEWDEETHFWQDGADGNGEWIYHTIYYDIHGTEDSMCHGTLSWPASRWPILSNVTEVVDGWCPGRYSGPLNIGLEHCDVSDPRITGRIWWYAYGMRWIVSLEEQSYERHAQTVMKLYTGGKAFPSRPNLWVASATAAHVLDKRAVPPYHPNPPLCEEIGLGQITVGDFGRQGTDGRVYKVLPEGATVDITPRVDGTDFYIYDVNATKHHLIITANGLRLDNHLVLLSATPDFCVGQKVTFNEYWDQYPEGIVGNDYDWTASVKCVNYQSSPNSAGCITYENRPDSWRISMPSAWWVTGGTKRARLKLKLTFQNGQTATVTQQGEFSMFRPKVWLAPFGPGETNRYYTLESLGSLSRLKLGENDGSGDGTMRFGVFLNSRFAGVANFTQLITAAYSNPAYLFSEERCDGAEFYNDGPSGVTASANPNIPTGLVNLDDGPYNIWSTLNILSLSCRDFVRFKPGDKDDPNNIWVTLGIVRWNTYGIAAQDPLLGFWWIVDENTSAPDGPDGSDEFPQWTVCQGGMR